MPSYVISITRVIEADSRKDALRYFWEQVDDAENEDLKIEED